MMTPELDRCWLSHSANVTVARACEPHDSILRASDIMTPKMKHFVLYSVCLIVSFASSADSQDSGYPVHLPSGKVLLGPPAGALISDLNAFPINSTSSP